jgi:hypothetical protein
LAVLLIWKVTLSTVVEFRHYIPPDFTSDFLRGRERYFWGAYSWAFYVHLCSGPTTLLLATILVSPGFRQAVPTWHRRFGRIQAACVLLLLVPSGLWMAFYAATGFAAALGLGSLAVVTAACVVLGWRAAKGRDWSHHERWMWRTFILLSSAVFIRLFGGLATVAGWHDAWLYPMSTWISWLVPLLILELSQRVPRANRRAAGPIG